MALDDEIVTELKSVTVVGKLFVPNVIHLLTKLMATFITNLLVMDRTLFDHSSRCLCILSQRLRPCCVCCSLLYY